MAKRKRKIYSTQRSKEILAGAKYAKKHHLISKQTKLHGGKYVSRRVAKRILELLPSIELRQVGLKVPRRVLLQKRAEGFLTAGTRLISPNAKTPEGRRFQREAKAGKAGLKPVKQGFLEHVQLSHDIMDMRQFVEDARRDPDKYNRLKLPDEQFAFKLYGNESYQPFLNIQSLIDYMSHYRSIFDGAGDLKLEHLDELWENFGLFRLTPFNVSTVLRNRDQREKERLARNRRRNKYTPADELTESRYAYLKRKNRLKQRRRRKFLTDSQREAIRNKDRLRKKPK